MWPLRPQSLTEVLPREEIESLLGSVEGPGSAVAFVELLADGGCETVASTRDLEETSPDPFCTFLRHGRAGGAIAFAGADRICAECEEKFARKLLTAATGAREVGANGRRCHMGLTDFAALVEIGGKSAGCVLGGRCVSSEDDRHRIRKIVGKLGKLTRAEAAGGATSAPIQPRSERARERLIEEIAQIPLASPATHERLRDLADRIGRLATRQHDALRLRAERQLLSLAEAWPSEVPRSFGYLARTLGALLEILRGELAVEYLAVFARTPRELEASGETVPSLVAEAGLGVGTKRRWLELDPSRLPPPSDGPRGVVARGLAAVSSAITSIRTLGGAPPELKDRLTKSIFFAPVELRLGLDGAVAFGPPSGEIPPGDDDYVFLAQLAQAILRRYYTALLELERVQARNEAERIREKLKGLETTVAEYREEKKAARETRGFSRFDAGKLILTTSERVSEELSTRRLEIDTRSLPERFMLHAHRGLLGEALQHMFRLGAERSGGESDEQKPSPLLAFVRERKGGRLQIGVEAIGDYLNASSRRALLGLPDEPRGSGSRGGGRERAGGGGKRGRRREERRKPPGSEEPALEDTAADAERRATSAEHATAPARRTEIVRLFAIARRHHGKFRLDSERLRRYESDPRRWLGKTTLFLELPLEFVAVRQEEAGAGAHSHRRGRRGGGGGSKAAEQPASAVGESSGSPSEPLASAEAADSQQDG